MDNMSKYLITGQAKLTGEIAVTGAKNAALKAIAASVLTDQPCVIKNCPDIEDVRRLTDILTDLGAIINWQGNALTINNRPIKKANPDPKLVKKLRSSIMLAGPLLARFGEVTLAHPGGCIIGQRPIDMFLAGFEKMGATINDQQTEDCYTLTAKQLTGAKIILPWISVTVTESLMLTACLARGVTTIINAAMEPEIPALADYLNRQGAKISGAGTPRITIEGVSALTGGEIEIIPDRIEAGSFAIMGLATNSSIKITHCRPEHLETVISTLERAGARLTVGPDYIITEPSQLRATELRTHEYPGFPTDLQAPFAVLMTQAKGQSLIHETIYDGRLFYTDKLKQMGANIIMCDPHRVIITGPTELYGRQLESPDLRAGMALLIAGLIATGQTTIDNVYQIERGYENIVNRLRALGAAIKKIAD